MKKLFLFVLLIQGAIGYSQKPKTPPVKDTIHHFIPPVVPPFHPPKPRLGLVIDTTAVTVLFTNNTYDKSAHRISANYWTTGGLSISHGQNYYNSSWQAIVDSTIFKITQ